MIHIVVNADDFGMNDDVNNAIVYCFVHKLISNTTIMPNMPSSDKAIQLAKDKGFFNKVGLHLNIRENVPMTENIRRNQHFCDYNGLFKMNLAPIVRYFFPIWALRKETRDGIVSEFDTQIKWYIDSGFQEMHIDSHQSIHTWFLFLSALNPLFKAYSFKSMRLRVSGYREATIKKLYRAFINLQIQSPVYALYDISTFMKLRDRLQDNRCYEVMCHPIMRDGHPVDALSGIPIEEIAKSKNIRMVSYFEL